MERGSVGRPPRRASELHVDDSGPCSSGRESCWVSATLPTGMRRGNWSADQFQLREPIHKGSVSRVHVAIDLLSDMHVALKQYNKRKLSTLSRYQVQREITLHLQLEHENVIQLYAAWEDDQAVYLVQELARGGDLFKEVKKRDSEEPADESLVVQNYMYPFLSALKYLHGKGICHRDIKPENILLTADGVLKLADFGLAINTFDERPVTRAGTLQYMAPEVLVCPEKSLPEENKERKELAYTCQVDVWAGGILAYELLLGHTPFGKEPRQLSPEYVMNVIDKQPELPFWMSRDAKSFIKATLCKDPDIRPSAKQLLKHPWIKTHLGRRRTTSTSLSGRGTDDLLLMAGLDSPARADSPGLETRQDTPGVASPLSSLQHASLQHPSLLLLPHLSPHLSPHLPPLSSAPHSAGHGHGAGAQHGDHATVTVLPQNGVLSDDSLLTGMVGRALSYASAQHLAYATPLTLGRKSSIPLEAETPRGMHDHTRRDLHPADQGASPSSSTSPHVSSAIPFGRHKLTTLIHRMVRGSPTPSQSGGVVPTSGPTAPHREREPAFAKLQLERDDLLGQHSAARSASRDRGEREEPPWRDRAASSAMSSPKPGNLGTPKSRSNSYAAPRVPTPRMAGQEASASLQRTHRSSGNGQSAMGSPVGAPVSSLQLRHMLVPSSPSRSPTSAVKQLLSPSAAAPTPTGSGTPRTLSSRKLSNYGRTQ